MNITDLTIIDTLITVKNDKAILNTCRLKEPWLKKHDLYDYLLNRYGDTENIQEVIYRIYYNLPDNYKLYCKTCNKPIPLEFVSFIKGYKQYCSYKCSVNDLSKIISNNSSNITDDTIINKVVDSNGNLISTYCTERKLKEFGFYDYMMNRYSDLSKNASVIQEILYRMVNNMETAPVCPVCGNILPFYRFKGDNIKPGGYRKHCSNKCSNKDALTNNQKKHNKRQTIEQKWHDRGYHIQYIDNDNFLVYDQCALHNPFNIKNHIFFNRIKYPHVTLCPICNPERNSTTSIEQIVKDILDKHNISYIQHCRNIISPKELDFYIPKYNLALECNGIYWHSGNTGKASLLEKYKLVNQLGIQLLTFWEDTIIYDTSKVEHIILTHCNKNKRIYARKCEIKEISPNESKVFLDMYHLQGNVNAKVKLGLFYNGELLEVMTFGKLRKCLGNAHMDNAWELYRLCTKGGYTVIGGASKLLSFFTHNYQWAYIVSYCHQEISNGNVYKQLGFAFDKNCGQGYSYYNYKISNKRINRFNLRKNVINDNSGRTADEILKDNGYLKCYDAGVFKYIMYNKK